MKMEAFEVESGGRDSYLGARLELSERNSPSNALCHEQRNPSRRQHSPCEREGRRDRQEVRENQSDEGLASIRALVMIDMIKDYAKGNYREVPALRAIGAVALALLYAPNPIDVIPDVLVGLGYLDDATVVAFALKLIDTELNRYKTWREKRDAEAGAQPTGKVVDVRGVFTGTMKPPSQDSIAIMRQKGYSPYAIKAEEERLAHTRTVSRYVLLLNKLLPM